MQPVLTFFCVLLVLLVLLAVFGGTITTPVPSASSASSPAGTHTSPTEPFFGVEAETKAYEPEGPFSKTSERYVRPEQPIEQPIAWNMPSEAEYASVEPFEPDGAPYASAE
jgi:hypothetical protein